MTCYFFKQLLNGVKFCNDNGIDHCDAKLEFLSLIVTGKTEDLLFLKASSPTGTASRLLLLDLYNVTPELIDNTCYRWKNLDVWSIGVILYRMFTLGRPFDCENTAER